jgi:hypothetical protein
LAGARYLSRILAPEDFPSPLTLPFFTVIRFLPRPTSSVLESFADSFADAIITVSNTTFPSFHYAHAFAKWLPRDIFLAKVIPRFERQLLRVGETFLPICVPVLPKLAIPVGERSIGRALLIAIQTKSQPNAAKLLAASAACYNADELFAAAVAVMQSNPLFDARTAVAAAISSIPSFGLSPETLHILTDFIKSEKVVDIQLKSLPITLSSF